MEGTTWPVSQLGKLPHPQKAHTRPFLCLQHYFLLFQSGLLPVFQSALTQEKCPGRRTFQEQLCGYYVEGVAIPSGTGITKKPVSQRLCQNGLGNSTCWHLPRLPCTRGVGQCVLGGSLILALLIPITGLQVAHSYTKFPDLMGRLEAVFQSLAHRTPFLPSTHRGASPSQITTDSPGRRWSRLLSKSPHAERSLSAQNAV